MDKSIKETKKNFEKSNSEIENQQEIGPVKIDLDISEYENGKITAFQISGILVTNQQKL